MKFIKDEVWNWEDKVMLEKKIVLQEVIYNNASISGNGDQHTVLVTENIREGNVSQELSPNRQATQESEASVDVSPIPKVRTLREIYDSCSFVLEVTNPGSFDEVQQHEEWRNAMVKEISAIAKSKT